MSLIAKAIQKVEKKGCKIARQALYIECWKSDTTMRHLQQRCSGRSNSRRGFTLLELLAVIATITTLAALLLPALNRAKSEAYQATCLSNLSQLGIAWMMYKDDNNDRLVETWTTYKDGNYAVDNPSVWVKGDMTIPAEAVNPDLIKAGKLYHYNENVQIYHCPTDPGVTIAGVKLQSVRSYSMNSFLGSRPDAAPANPNAAPGSSLAYTPFFSKISDMPDASRLFVLIDEDQRSISDGAFVTDPTARLWYSFPAVSAARHNYGSSRIFADGHAAPWHFLDASTALVSSRYTDGLHNKDLENLAATATVSTPSSLPTQGQ